VLFFDDRDLAATALPATEGDEMYSGWKSDHYQYDWKDPNYKVAPSNSSISCPPGCRALLADSCNCLDGLPPEM
jgi:hypothetical protein